MPVFPVVDNEGCLDKETVILTKPLLGFYVEKTPISRVEGYVEGLRDTCFLLSDTLNESKGQQDLTLDEFRKQLSAMIEDRLDLADTMSNFIRQRRFEKQDVREPS